MSKTQKHKWSTCPDCGGYSSEGHTGTERCRAYKPAQGHTPGPDDQWELLRSKLTLREAQYLNTYTKTGDIAALNCLVLGIIAQREEAQRQIEMDTECIERHRVGIYDTQRALLSLIEAFENARQHNKIGWLEDAAIKDARAAIAKAQQP